MFKLLKIVYGTGPKVDCDVFIFIFIVVKARETNRVNDITVGQKGT